MKPQALLDVNVLLALVWTDHVDHARVVRWHRDWLPNKWVLCPLSEAGFLRLSLNPAFTAGHAAIEILLETMRRLRSQPGCVRIAGGPDPVDPRFEPIWKKVRGHQQVMDALFLSTAVAADIHLATMDKQIRALSDHDDRVILIP